MAASSLQDVVKHLRRIVVCRDGAGLTDGQLLGCFINDNDDAAFQALVKRHGGMVLSVCRRILRHHHDAEDAFQATFLVLARKAREIKPRDMVSNWLYGVARRTALKARALTSKRQSREMPMMDTAEPIAPQSEMWNDLRPLLDHALCRLPDKYRQPIVLCDLEGKSIKEVMRQLGWPQGTVAGRLARGRLMLARRLNAKGLALSVSATVAVLAENVASAGLPPLLVHSTAKIASLAALGQAGTNGIASPVVVALTEGVLNSMLLSKLKVVSGVLLIVCATAVAGGLVARQFVQDKAGAAQSTNTIYHANRVPRVAVQAEPNETKLEGEWIGKSEKDYLPSRLFFGPKNSVAVLRDQDDSGTMTGKYAVNWQENPHHLDVQWEGPPERKTTRIMTIMEFMEEGKLSIQMTLNGAAARPTEFSWPTMVLTRVRTRPRGSKEAEADALTIFEIADFYSRRGFPGSAFYQYELIRLRYPETTFANKATELAAALKSKHYGRLPDGSQGWWRTGETAPPRPANDDNTVDVIKNLREQVASLEKQLADLQAKLSAKLATMRVGEIIVVGNDKTPTSTILKDVGDLLHPGQEIQAQTLTTAQTKLAPFHATISVLESSAYGGLYRDVLIMVRED